MGQKRYRFLIWVSTGNDFLHGGGLYFFLCCWRKEGMGEDIWGESELRGRMGTEEESAV